mgnify:CR=1 FL=1
MIIEQEYTTGKYGTWDFSNDAGLQYNKTTLAYETYTTANYHDRYWNKATERGTASGIYEVAVPTVVAAGNFKARFRVGVEGAEAETDTIVATQRYYALDDTGVQAAAAAALTAYNSNTGVAKEASVGAISTTLGTAGAGLTAVGLAATGLDAIAATRPTGKATTFPQMIVQLFYRFFGKAVKDISDNTIKTYAANGTTVVTTQTIAETITTETQGEAS